MKLADGDAPLAALPRLLALVPEEGAVKIAATGNLASIGANSAEYNRTLINYHNLHEFCLRTVSANVSEHT